MTADERKKFSDIIKLIAETITDSKQKIKLISYVLEVELAIRDSER